MIAVLVILSVKRSYHNASLNDEKLTHKAKKMPSLNKKDTFVWIKPNIIMTTPKENVSKVPWVVHSLF